MYMVIRPTHPGAESKTVMGHQFNTIVVNLVLQYGGAQKNSAGFE
jgi:hypothetical protein